ncbi:hypothetical protein SteCoe_34160 [Stentor coeruleus]|uniref:TmcB/TmcC TPR repeats domain-containing protein n=1 Tax=Stentor coeruleus TaxID=5963 RepID=A0A1R2AV39_9CILI|nr:hypothetical protein SteCoe_34160 [Stentor coeruleus]
MKNPMLGLNIITKLHLSGVNISINFQIYKCKCYLIKKIYQNSNSIKIIEYFNSFANTKENDKKFCQETYKFTNQLQSGKFSLSDLKYSTNNLVKYYKIVKNQYKDVHYNNPDAVEVKKYYESFLLGLLGDRSYKPKAFISSHKNNENLDKLSSKSYAFQSRRCFLVISCDLDSFGKIVHYDENFKNFLGFKSDLMKELYVENLIVSDFCKNPHKAMRNFIEKTLTHQALVNTIIPLLSAEGYLCESLINCEYISYRGALNFICSIDPLTYKKREIALLNNFGVIIGHSKNFTKLLGFDRENIIGELVSEILIGINYRDLCEDQIFLFKKSLNKSLYIEINGVLKKKRLGKLDQLILYITDSDEELISWRNNYEDFYCEKEYSITNYSCESNALKTIALNIERDQDDIATMGLDSLSKINKFRTIESYRLDVKSIPTFELKSLKKAVFVLNMTKVVLLLSILVMIAFNIAILSYIYLESSDSTSLSNILNLGDICYLLSHSSFVLRYIDISVHENYTAYYTFEDANNILLMLESKKNLLINEYSRNSDYPSSKIIKESIIPYWKLEKIPKVYFSNLPDLLEIYLLNSRFIISNMQQEKRNYSDHLFFTTYISIGKTFDHIYESLKSLEKFELDKIEKLNTMNLYFFFVGFAVICCCFVFMLGFLFTIDKPLNFLWDYLRRKILSKSFDIKKTISERMSKFHKSIIIDEDDIEVANEIKYKNLEFHHSFHYSWRFFILFIFVVVFYVLNTYVFEKKILYNMQNRPDLVSLILERRVMSSKMCFFTFEIDLGSSDLSLISLYPEFNSIYPLDDKLLETIKFLISSQKKMLSRRSEGLMSNTLKNIIMKGDFKNNSFLAFGSIRGLYFLTQESQFISFNGFKENHSSISKFIEEVKEYENLGEIAIDMVNNDSKNIIKGYVNDLLKFNIFCYLAVLIAYVAYYHPFLNYEIRLLYKIAKILKLVSRGFRR